MRKREMLSDRKRAGDKVKFVAAVLQECTDGQGDEYPAYAYRIGEVTLLCA